MLDGSPCRLSVVVLALLYLTPASAVSSLLAPNAQRCEHLAGRPLQSCAQFSDFNASREGCLARESEGEVARQVSPEDAYRCLNASLCLAVYDVPQCVGPLGFNYSVDVFNHTACVSLVVALNASFGGALAPFAEGAGCEALLGATGDSRGSDTTADGRGARIDELFRAPSLPPLPRFHPCASALNGARVERLRLLATRARHYVSHTVVALSPDIGPVAGGVSIGVCGFGFSQANEAVGHLACRFTDGTNRVDTPAMYVDQNQLSCDAPDFTRFAVGLPHNVSVEISTSRGDSWTDNQVPFTFYATRPAIDAFGRPMWGYESSFTKSAWQAVDQYDHNYFGPSAEPLYPSSGHPLNGGRPSQWDSHRDPFHGTGASAAWLPVELDVGERFDPAADLAERARHSAHHGVEGSWGDRRSFLRAHSLVPDVYRQDVAAARMRVRQEIEEVTNGVL